MPVRYLKNVARIEGVGAVEDAEGLLEWLHEHPRGRVDLRACEHFHGALLQVFMALRPCIAACPREGTPAAAIMAAVYQDEDAD